MSKRTLFTTAAVSALIAGFAAVPARAEFVDYGALQDVFGEPVTTSATGSPKKASEVPMSMTIISAEQIGRAAAPTIPGILREYTDLDVWQWSAGGSDVGVRGYDQAASPRILVLINGRQVYLDYYGITNWNSLPVQLSEIRQIEVVKGPNSALFGFNAAGGVINIVTFNPLYDSVNEVVARVGNDGYHEGSAVATAHIAGIAGIRLSAGGMNEHEFNDHGFTGGWAGTAATSSGPDRRSVSMDSVFQITDDLQAGLEATKGKVKELDVTSTYSGFVRTTDTDSIKGSFSANTGAGQVEGSVYRNNMSIAYATTAMPVNDIVTVASLRDMFKIGADHTFRIATEYRYTTMNTTPDLSGVVNYSVYSGSGMWDWAASSKLDITNALRFDSLQLGRTGQFAASTSPYTNAAYDGRSLSKLAANSGAVYKLTDVDSARATFARGLQIPSQFDFGYLSGTGKPGTFSDPNIQPVIVTNYELGYSHDFRDYGTKLSSSVFYETSDNLIGVPIATPGMAYAENIGSSAAKGMELAADGHSANGFRWGGNWRTEYISDTLTNANPTVVYKSSTPHQLLSARAGYTLAKWDFDLYSRFSTSYRVSAGATASEVIPSYATLDARVGYRVTENVLLAASAIGIQSKTTDTTSGQPSERQFFGSVTVKF